ncbi:hypothetical protein [Moorena sp. SIO3I8]|uniref:hypothetical protein n=1 Tax=Moorena sp. SIO3I8 TaxID=2607833 RepID=UPI0013C10E74|nr:hypothetical protein [Moorena sp. SIO3I8]NEO04808.1 hypothetical protein [Moorena sp. SIO3I8]
MFYYSFSGWNGHVGGMGMLVAWACWWHGHVGGMGMLVAWACWWHGHVGGMGMLVEWASCPLSIFGEPVSKPPYAIPDSRLPTPDSLLPIPFPRSTYQILLKSKTKPGRTSSPDRLVGNSKISTGFP